MINLFLEKENILIKYKDVEYNLSKDFIELPQENILKSGEIKNVFIKVIKNYRNGFISVLLSDINYETKHIISVDDVNIIWFSNGYGITKKEGISWTTYNSTNTNLPSNCSYITFVE